MLIPSAYTCRPNPNQDIILTPQVGNGFHQYHETYQKRSLYGSWLVLKHRFNLLKPAANQIGQLANQRQVISCRLDRIGKHVIKVPWSAVSYNSEVNSTTGTQSTGGMYF